MGRIIVLVRRMVRIRKLLLNQQCRSLVNKAIGVGTGGGGGGGPPVKKWGAGIPFPPPPAFMAENP